ncbi:MAG: phage scaffolding protein [Clostridia bacterium]|jgi:hypothetical protein|nr:phage scaffolding protein [Clostridia bacterium]
MTLEELFKARGIDDTNIKAILDDMKLNKIFTAGEENLDIRYGKLKTQHEGVTKQLTEANTLIESLKESNKGNEELQGKISAYEAQIQQLTEELENAKLESAIKVELLTAKALDVDYLTFKLKEKGELALDENGKIKNWDDKLAGLKTQFPTQFENESKKNIIEYKLPGGDKGDVTVTREQFLKMGYNERLALKQENEQLYKQLANH